jgi:hypothetical protein
MTKNKASALRRYDRPGHLDPAHAGRLLALARAGREVEDDSAFLRTSAEADDLACELGQTTVASMTSGEGVLTNELEAQVEEDVGGPFVETSASEEFGEETDEEDARDATREPTPVPSPAPDEPDEPIEPGEPGEPDEFEQAEEGPVAVRSWAGSYLLRAKDIAGWLGFGARPRSKD